MANSVGEFLINFDRLSESQRLDVAVNLDFHPLSEANLVLNAEELFLEIDRQEAVV